MVRFMAHPLLTYIETTPGETRETFCDRADISRMTLWRLTKGEGECSTKLLRKVSQATGGKITEAALAKAFEQAKANSGERAA